MLVSLSDEEHRVLFEAEVSKRQLDEIGVADDVLDTMSGRLSDVSDLVRRVVASLAHSLDEVRDLGRPPTTAEVNLGIKVDGEGRAFVAKAGAGASLVLTLTWNLSGDGQR
jgi:hypothetical protein